MIIISSIITIASRSHHHRIHHIKFLFLPTPYLTNDNRITMMSDMPLTEPKDLLLLLQDRRALLSLIGVSLATALFVVERFKQHILLMPAFLFVPMILFWIIAVSTGTSGSQLQQMGFIIPSTETVPFYSIWTSLDLSAVEYVS